MTKSGEECFAKRVIIALPPHLAAAFEYVPALPLKRLRLMQHSLPGLLLPRLFLALTHLVGCAMKVIVTYATPFWREAGFSGTCIDCHSLLSGIFDGCTPSGDAALIIFIMASKALQWHERSPDGTVSLPCSLACVT